MNEPLFKSGAGQNLAIGRVRLHDDGMHTVEIDTSKATYKNMKWSDLGGWGKRKFENLIVMAVKKQPLVIRYL